MAQLTKAQLAAENQSDFPNNNSGLITPDILRGFNTDMIDSLVDEVSYNIDSASFSSSIAQLQSFSSSLDATFATDAQLTSLSASIAVTDLSQSSSIAALQVFSSSLDATFATDAQLSASVAALSSSVAVTDSAQSASIAALQSFSSSLDATFATDAQLSASVSALSSSVAVTDLAQSQSIAQLLGFSSSLSVDFVTEAEFGAYSSSINSFTSSINSYTQSNDSKVNSLISKTGSYATTGSNTFLGNQVFSGSTRFDLTTDPGNSFGSSSFLFQSQSSTALGVDLYVRQNGNLVKWKWIEGNLQTGLIYGGDISFSGSTLFVKPGSGIIVDYNATTSSEYSPIIDLVNWGAQTQSLQYLTSSQITFVSIDPNGVAQQQLNNFTDDEYADRIPLGSVLHANKISPTSVTSNVATTYNTTNQTFDFIRAFGPVKQDGLTISAYATSSLGFSISSGTSFILGGFYNIDPNNISFKATSAVTQSLTSRVYRSGSSGEYISDNNNGNFYNTIDPTKWDDGSGTLQNTPAGQYTVQRVFMTPITSRCATYYGQVLYNSIAEARQNADLEGFNEASFTTNNFVYLGYIIVKGNATSLPNTADAALVPSGIFRSTVSGGGGTVAVTNLNDLGDVTITSAINGQGLIYNAGLWVNGNPTSASFAQTAVTATTSSYVQSASFAENAGLLDGKDSSEFATTGSNSFKGIQYLSASLYVRNGDIYHQSDNTSINPDLYLTESLAGQVNIIKGWGDTVAAAGPGLVQSNYTGSIRITGSNNTVSLPQIAATGLSGTSDQLGYISGSDNQILSNNAGIFLNTGSLLTPKTQNNILTNGSSIRMNFLNSGSLTAGNPLVISNLLLGGVISVNSNSGSPQSISTNILNGGSIASIQSFATNTKPTISSNIGNGGTVTLNHISSSITYQNNNVNATLNVNNHLSSSGLSTNGLSVTNNMIFGGSSSSPINIYVSGSQNSNASRVITDSIIGGRNINISSSFFSSSNASLVSSVIVGNGLTVSASHVASSNGGTAFFGRFNDTGSLSSTQDIIFAVGTGTSLTSRRTGLWIDTGSNTNISGTLEVIGNTAFTGSVDVSGSTLNLNNSGGLALKVFSGSVEVTSPQGTGYFYSNLPITSSGLRINGTGLLGDLIVSGVFSGNSSLQVFGSSSFTGSVFTSASVSGVVNPLTISSQTASLDFSKGNFFTIQLVSGSSTHINPTNVIAGQTVNIRVNTTGSGIVTFPTTVKQVNGITYTPTSTTSVDVLTMVTFDASNVYLANVKNLI